MGKSTFWNKSLLQTKSAWIWFKINKIGFCAGSFVNCIAIAYETSGLPSNNFDQINFGPNIKFTNNYTKYILKNIFFNIQYFFCADADLFVFSHF